MLQKNLLNFLFFWAFLLFKQVRLFALPAVRLHSSALLQNAFGGATILNAEFHFCTKLTLIIKKVLFSVFRLTTSSKRYILFKHKKTLYLAYFLYKIATFNTMIIFLLSRG